MVIGQVHVAMVIDGVHVAMVIGGVHVFDSDWWGSRCYGYWLSLRCYGDWWGSCCYGILGNIFSIYHDKLNLNFCLC